MVVHDATRADRPKRRFQRTHGCGSSCDAIQCSSAPDPKVLGFMASTADLIVGQRPRDPAHLEPSAKPPQGGTAVQLDVPGSSSAHPYALASWRARITDSTARSYSQGGSESVMIDRMGSLRSQNHADSPASVVRPMGSIGSQTSGRRSSGYAALSTAMSYNICVTSTGDPIPAPPHLHPTSSSTESLGQCCTGARRGRTFDREHIRTSSLQSNVTTASSVERAELATTLSAPVLRGVRLERAMRGFGLHWTGLEGTAKAFEESEYTESIDAFVSHDWQTGRWVKFCTLCLIFNGRPALVSSCIAGLVLGLMQREGFLEGLPSWNDTDSVKIQIRGRDATFTREGGWCILACPLVFSIVFVFWQRIRGHVLRRPTMAFVDKLCICQEDGDLKTRGILGIAGFMKISQALVVLWSPRFFTRLWCVYEIASWIHLRKSLNMINFMPVAKAQAIMCMMFVVEVLVVLCVVSDWDYASLGTLQFLIIGMVIAAATMLVHTMRRLVRDIGCLGEQLQHFSIRDASCFCCSQARDHIHPETGLRMACDRKLVHNMLKTWFTFEWQLTRDSLDTAVHSSSSFDASSNHSCGGGGGPAWGRRHLDLFDRHIRTDFSRIVLATAGPSRIDYCHSLIVSAPILWHTIDRLYLLRAGQMSDALQILAELLIVSLALVPSAVKLFLHMVVLFDSVLAEPRHFVLDVLASCLMTGATLVMLLLLLVPYHISVSRLEVWIPQAALSCLAVALVAWLYRPVNGASYRHAWTRSRSYSSNLDLVEEFGTRDGHRGQAIEVTSSGGAGVDDEAQAGEDASDVSERATKNTEAWETENSDKVAKTLVMTRQASENQQLVDSYLSNSSSTQTPQIVGMSSGGHIDDNEYELRRTVDPPMPMPIPEEPDHTGSDSVTRHELLSM